MSQTAPLIEAKLSYLCTRLQNPATASSVPPPLSSMAASSSIVSIIRAPRYGFSRAGRTNAPASAFLHLSSSFPWVFPNTPLRDHMCASQFQKNPGFAAKPLRTPGVAYATAATEKSIYDFTVKDIDEKDVSLSKFKGKVLLIVNVASKCGLTTSNYTELSHIYEKYKTQGFEILAFPCNQFGGQEPGSNSEIKQFACTRYKAEFPIFDKVDVNGPNTAPVYQFLKSSAGGFLGDLIKWNFEKFLVDKNGKVVERYPPTTSPFQIERDLQKLLAA